MTLRRYHDPEIAEEVSSSMGEYLMSYATELNLIEAHLFEGAKGELKVFLSIIPGVPLPEAQAVADEAARLFESERGGSPPRKPRLVYEQTALFPSGRL